MSELSEIKLYSTYPHDCSYLPDRQATTLFIDPKTPVTREIYTRLSEIGFRRSGTHIYRPRCESCQACIPARIPVASFKRNRNQQRCWTKNQDIDALHVGDISHDEYYELYSRYINGRHADGDMYPPDEEQYQSFLCSPSPETLYAGFHLAGELLGVAVIDVLENGLSAIYTFYEPKQDTRSLGKFFILWQIEHARALGLDYLYLGYWIADCQKMSYKSHYRPLEIYRDGRWTLLESDE
ncbi:MAG: arginyltransferase [Pseudomonadales bacterium]